ncbi:MAG: toprim domain-containing protein, partial [Chloroflexales bacterium]|nr:toprim domain-containing protein [Chloroflexales bacterium]
VVDLRTRTYDGQKGYRSLGPYSERGAIFPFGWDSVRPGTRTVIITEAEFKALAALQAYHAGELDAPTLGQPGLTVFREAWAQQLVDRGVEEVVLCYDSQPRATKEGLPALAPEEQWSLRHGAVCAAAGLRVRVARLPLAPGQEKAEIDTFLTDAGADRFQQIIATAPLLLDYHRALGHALLERHNLPLPSTYPVRRERPVRLTIREAAAELSAAQGESPAAPLAETRTQIAALVEQYVTEGEGFLVLAHPPGTGKGFNTALGLRQWMQSVPTGDDGSGFLVWTAQRKEQVHDQQGIPLIPLSGRHPGNCRKLAEAQILAQKGYSVKDALCARRCPFVGGCRYMRQFGQEGDFFASAPLLKATGWWEQAGVVVLDEFDPAGLITHVQLTSADLAAMSRASPKAPAIQTALRWVAQALATTTDRTLGGVLLLDELTRQAEGDGADLATILTSALAELPPPNQLNMLIGLPTGATLADYQALPPGHTATLLAQIAKELQLRYAGRRCTSRIEARGGRLELFLRVEHLITRLARADQPKIILDATVNAGLLTALFPGTPVRVEQPNIAGAARVIQVVGRDWAKRSLRNRSANIASRQRERWIEDVVSHLRPGRKTLVVCTLEWEEELRAGLAERGHTDVAVAHYGALRGSNAYQGHDVILAQVYHPNLDAIIREGRALFADDPTPLDERVITEPRVLHDATGAAWNVQVPTFTDPRLAALLQQRREAELLQCALRGRPFDHPDVQITLLFSLPVPGLSPTVIVEAPTSPTSNGGRERATKVRLCAAAQQLLDRGARVIEVGDLARAAQASVATVRRHLTYVAARLRLQLLTRRRMVPMPRGGARHYERLVLLRRGRIVPAQSEPPPLPPTTDSTTPMEVRLAGDQTMMDQARRKRSLAGVIHHRAARGRRRRVALKHRPRCRSRPPPG